jgi:hypothetical protein
MVTLCLRRIGIIVALAPCLAGSALAAVTTTTPGYNDCGQLGDGYGPFDYRTAPMNERKTVESFHFTREVENLTRGNTTSTPAGDIDYTLRAFPNHHRALRAMMNAGLKAKTEKPSGSRYTISCWFERAIVFAPDDGTVYMLYGTYLLRRGNAEAAIRRFNQAQEFSSGDANLEYNLGLAYFSAKDYEKALQHAHEAYRLGFPLPGLRDMLDRAGKWRDAPPGSASPLATEGGAEAPPAAARTPPLPAGAAK